MKHITEKKYPLQTEGFKRIINKMYEVHLAKNFDYSPANIVVAGELGIIIRIWDKFCRICNLMGVSFPSVRPEVEKTKAQVLGFFEPGTETYDIVASKFDELAKKCEFDWAKFGEKEAANEPLDDAWLDLANYSVIGFLHRKNLWGR